MTQVIYKRSVFLKIFILMLGCTTGPFLVAALYSIATYHKVNYGCSNPLVVVIGISILLSIIVTGFIANEVIAPVQILCQSIKNYRTKKVFSVLNTNKDDEFLYLFKEYESLIRDIENHQKELLKTAVALHETKLKAEIDHAIAETAARVAHDIRSPLISLSMISKRLPELSEENRTVIRNSMQRISDIANNLLSQYKLKKEDLSQPELVSSLLDSLVSEKRAQLTEKSIDLILELKDDAYSSFVRLEAGEFKRMISNLINNAFEALPDYEGVIRLTLEKRQNSLEIKIIDNGKGIPVDILPEIKQGGLSVGKKEGSGLGISGATQSIKKWNGSYDIKSEEGKGTTFAITLPITEAPAWFQDSITIFSGQRVVALDDDESIHDVWKTVFKDFLASRQITLYNFHTVAEFFEYCRTLASQRDLFLVDYELLGSDKTGLDLIRIGGIENAILVTCRYEELEVREKAKNLGVKIIPKNFAPYVPINCRSSDFHNSAG